MYLRQVLKQYVECIRLKDWWNYIVPPVIGFYLWGLYQAQLNFKNAFFISSGFILLTFSVASFGFFLNEWTDITDDRNAGKKNRVADLSVSLRIIIFIFILLQMAAGHAISIHSLHTNLLFGLQIILLVLYSCPPFRLKKYLHIAPLFDAFYSGTLFYLLAININYPTFFGLTLTRKIALCMLFIWAITRGFRNIIIHFLEDIEYDSAISQKTIGTHYDLSSIIKFLKWGLFPVEIISFCLFAFVERSRFGLTLGILYLLFIFYWINRKKYIIPYLVKRKNGELQIRIYDINMFHEVILPLAACLFLIIKVDLNYFVYLFLLFLFFRDIRNWVIAILLLPASLLKK